MASLSKHREAVEESLGGARDDIDVGFQLSSIVYKLCKAIVADVKSEVIRCYVLELMRFIKYDGAVVRQYRCNVRLSYGEIRQEKMVIYHHDVGFHGLLAHECQKTSIVVFTLRAKTSITPGIHAGP